MYFLSDTVKNRIWDELVNTRPRPPAMTNKRIELAKRYLWNNSDFWYDIAFRHGLNEKELNQTDKEIRLHAIGNFWGQLFNAHQKRINEKREKL